MKPLVLLIAFLIVGCSDVVDSHYSTYKEASKSQLFARGWLPNILPESVTDISVSNDLDQNTSVGSFVLQQPKLEIFLSQLSKVDSESDRFEYQQAQNVWVFSIKENGLVNYRMSVNR